MNKLVVAVHIDFFKMLNLNLYGLRNQRFVNFLGLRPVKCVNSIKCFKFGAHSDQYHAKVHHSIRYTRSVLDCTHFAVAILFSVFNARQHIECPNRLQSFWYLTASKDLNPPATTMKALSSSQQSRFIPGSYYELVMMVPIFASGHPRTTNTVDTHQWNCEFDIVDLTIMCRATFDSNALHRR